MNKNLHEQVKHSKLIVTRLEEQLVRKQENENNEYEELEEKYNQLYRAFKTLQEEREVNKPTSPWELAIS